MTQATQQQYDDLAIHCHNMYSECFDLAEAYHHARLILEILHLEHKDLNEHMVKLKVNKQ